MIKERIQKVLAQAGFGSRRHIEKLIVAGRIKVNNKPAQLGDRISSDDKVAIDDKLCRLFAEPVATRVLLYHKPVDEICTRSDPEGRRCVFDALPPIRGGRWVSVGRLDINTSGLLLFTNNGELANRLMHPSTMIEREYAVRILGTVNADMAKRLTHGVSLEDGKARFEDLVDIGGEGANHWFHVVVVEGRNRLVRRLWESQDVKVSRLARVRYGPIMLPKSLRRGAWLELDKAQVELLENALGQNDG